MAFLQIFIFDKFLFQRASPSNFRSIGGDFFVIKMLVKIGWFDAFSALFESFPEMHIKALQISVISVNAFLHILH